MKKKMLAVVFAALALGITACSGGKAPDSGTVNEQKTPEQPKEDVKQDDSEDEKEPENTKVTVKIYAINQESGEIDSETKEASELSEKIIWNLLKESGVLEEKTEALSLKKEGTKLNLDVNEAFGEQLRSYGTAGEQEILTCVVNSFLDSYECKQIKITEEGSVLVSGHAEYADYIEKFE